MTYNMYICMYSVYKVDYRGAAAPKNITYWHFRTNNLVRPLRRKMFIFLMI